THVAHPFAASFEVQEVLPMSVKPIAKRMRELQIGTLEIKQRGTGVEPADFRKKLKLSGGNAATLILTRIEGDHRAVIAHRVV
ncbi:THUMP-like domain-containing protein, partial [Agrococcus casei]|uniref:THUMP-like domain-containing protein n=1 Tax=Agrococcus casei TaxID=343512 RepID=UPI003F90FFEF